MGAAVALGAASLTETRRKGTYDNTNQSNARVISNVVLDTTNFLTADEAYKLVTTNSTVKDEIAAGIYYKDIGSRTGLTVSESDVEFTNNTDNVKTVYQNKAVTDIRKLVTEGYIKIERESQDVSISTEKATL